MAERQLFHLLCRPGQAACSLSLGVPPALRAQQSGPREQVARWVGKLGLAPGTQTGLSEWRLLWVQARNSKGSKFSRTTDFVSLSVCANNVSIKLVCAVMKNRYRPHACG